MRRGSTCIRCMQIFVNAALPEHQHRSGVHDYWGCVHWHWDDIYARILEGLCHIMGRTV